MTNPATITGDTDNSEMVFASPSGQFHLDETNSLRLSGLTHLHNFIVTRKSSPLTGTIPPRQFYREMTTPASLPGLAKNPPAPTRVATNQITSH